MLPVFSYGFWPCATRRLMTPSNDFCWVSCSAVGVSCGGKRSQKKSLVRQNKSEEEMKEKEKKKNKKTVQIRGLQDEYHTLRFRYVISAIVFSSLLRAGRAQKKRERQRRRRRRRRAC